MRTVNELEALCQRLEQAIRVLGVSYDHRLWLAFEQGRRVALGVLAPARWWRRLLSPTPEEFMLEVPFALAELDKQLKRCWPQENMERARHREAVPVAGPCLLSDRCEKCSSRSGLVAVVDDCTLGPSLGLRLACATLCEACMSTPLREIFGAAEIAVRIRRHAGH